MDPAQVHGQVAAVAKEFAADRRQRQLRTELDSQDFARLADAGLLSTGLPSEHGGLWQDVASSTRPIAEIFRTLAAGDSSVALVTSMHPAVLAFWMATPTVPQPDTAAWEAQRTAMFRTVEEGAWWGTITSEPGSGGDVTRSRAVARRDGDRWRLTGQKHFGSGTGMTSWMLTAAVPEQEERPDWFAVPVAGVPLDGSAGMSLIAPWDGHGMRATQSHALAFDDMPAERFAWPGHLDDIIAAAAPFTAVLFTAVVLGILETAVETAREQVAGRADSLRSYEQVEWTRAELEAWTALQAYEGALRTIESGIPGLGAALRAKTVVAELAESSLLRLCRVLGGATYSQRSPFGHWFEDVRALGFLRPPWGLASDGLLMASLAPLLPK